MTHHCKYSCAKAVAMRTARPARARRSRAPPTADRQKLRLAAGGKRNGPGTLGGRPGPFQIGVRSVGERTQPFQSVRRCSGSKLMLEFVPCHFAILLL